VEAIVQAGRKTFDPQHLDARRGELDGSGKPSRLRQISTTDGACGIGQREVSTIALARSTNNCTAGKPPPPQPFGLETLVGCERSQGGTRVRR